MIRTDGRPTIANDQRVEALTAINEIVDDFFAFQAAACTTQDGCPCGRHDSAAR